ncbi:hypothetical protein [Streptomyces lateritius]|uniref:hypothetical protein n=1 Tax=Streptomyces lateritius TaxID=67313 RepID=UPI001C8C33FB|nr:hypothetical protein [Streptomyces lateritius]MBX9425477.1 hypothetical protein [Streptomyces lateritius]
MSSRCPTRTSHAEVRTWSATYSRATRVFPFDWEWSHTQFMASKVIGFSSSWCER